MHAKSFHNTHYYNKNIEEDIIWRKKGFMRNIEK